MENNFQSKVHEWMLECFGQKVLGYIPERNHRFLEESLELVQSLGCSKDDAIKLVDYVFSRPMGYFVAEVGGVMVTLAALCGAADVDMEKAGDTELARVWEIIDKIREKWQNKPKHSPLPIHVGLPQVEYLDPVKGAAVFHREVSLSDVTDAFVKSRYLAASEIRLLKEFEEFFLLNINQL